jgi:hypothetical protein
LAALAGLLGDGPLGKSAMRTGDGSLRAEYLRFIRYHSPAELKIDIGAEATRHGVLELRIGNRFAHNVEIKHIEPEPELVTTGPEFCTYQIRVETNAATQIRVRFEATHFGRLTYPIMLADKQTMQLSHFAFP